MEGRKEGRKEGSLPGDYNPDSRYRREGGDSNGISARKGAKKPAYGGKEQAYPETITHTPDLGARRGVWNGLAARGCKEARVRWKEAGLHGDCNPEPRSRREKKGLERISGTRGCKEARLRWKEAGQHGHYNPDPRSRREKGGLERVVREGVKKRAYGRKKQAYTETITQTPDLRARRGVWDGL